MVEEHGGIDGIPRRFPEVLVERLNVRGVLEGLVFGFVVLEAGELILQGGGGVSPVAIGATEHDIRGIVHVFNAMMTDHAGRALGIGGGAGLIDAVSRGQGSGGGLCGGQWPFHGNRHADIEDDERPGSE